MLYLMKKKLKVLTALLISSITAISMFGCSSNNKTKEGKVTVRLNEVTRSVFYAPMYVAMKEGYLQRMESKLIYKQAKVQIKLCRLF